MKEEWVGKKRGSSCHRASQPSPAHNISEEEENRRGKNENAFERSEEWGGREDGRASVVACVMWGDRGRGSPVCVSLSPLVRRDRLSSRATPLPERGRGVQGTLVCRKT